MITIVLRMKEKFIDVKDFTFWYYERQWAPYGDNRQPVSVLFLHGYTSERTHWVSMVKFLPQHWRLILVDMPGHGRTSYKAKDDYTRKGYTEKINRVCPPTCCMTMCITTSEICRYYLALPASSVGQCVCVCVMGMAPI